MSGYSSDEEAPAQKGAGGEEHKNLGRLNELVEEKEVDKNLAEEVWHRARCWFIFFGPSVAIWPTVRVGGSIGFSNLGVVLI